MEKAPSILNGKKPQINRKSPQINGKIHQIKKNCP
jgi:hypothetical protein